MIRANSQRRTRSGFTLLEVILALALTTILVASLLSALNIYRRLSTAGQRDTRHAQLARALHDLVSDDIRSVVFREVEDESDEEEESLEEELGAAEEDTSASVETIEVTDPNDAYESGSIGLVGDTTTLVVHTNRPKRGASNVDVAFQELVAGGGRTSDLRSVSYFLAVRGGVGLQGAVAERLLASSGSTSTSTANAAEPMGLVRLEGDRLTMTLADQTGDYDTLAQGAELVAPEVKSLAFRYFDGAQWYDQWDAVAYTRLPRAVEITIGIRLDDVGDEVADPNSLESKLESRSPLVEHRFVVALPQAEPTPVEEAPQ